MYQTCKRYNAYDLTPAFLYDINVRLLWCSIFGYLFETGLPTDYQIGAYFLSFGIGFLPLSSLHNFIKTKTSKQLKITGHSDKPSDLYDLQGFNNQIVGRLEEENILSCENLAYCDPIKLFLKTNFQLKIILDWIDQALLYNYISDKLQSIREMGIRGVVEFAAIQESSEEIKKNLITSVADKLKILPHELEFFIDNFYDDPHVDFIWDLLSEYEDEKISDEELFKKYESQIKKGKAIVVIAPTFRNDYPHEGEKSSGAAYVENVIEKLKSGIKYRYITNESKAEEHFDALIEYHLNKSAINPGDIKAIVTPIPLVAEIVYYPLEEPAAFNIISKTVDQSNNIKEYNIQITVCEEINRLKDLIKFVFNAKETKIWGFAADGTRTTESITEEERNEFIGLTNIKV